MSSSAFPTAFSSGNNKDGPVGNGSMSSGGANGGGGGLGFGNGGGDWVRRANGVSAATNNTISNQTGPRRPSLSTTLTHPSNHAIVTPLTSTITPGTPGNIYQPPHSFNRDASAPFRYSKEDVLSVFTQMASKGQLDDKYDSGNKLKSLLLSGGADGSSGPGWGGGDRANNLGEVCWDKNGGLRPIGLEAMTAEERELFSSVNSPIKQHPAPNTPGGPNSTGGPGPQQQLQQPLQPQQPQLHSQPQSQPRASTSTTNLNNNYHKNNTSVSSTGTTGVAATTPGTASPTTRNRPRRDTSDQPFPPPITRRRTELRNSNDDQPIGFDRFSNTRGFNQQQDENKQIEEPQSAGPGPRSFFKRTASAGWGVPSPVTPSGSALSAFANGTFGGIGGGFMLNSGVPVAKLENEKKANNGSLGRSAGKHYLTEKILDEGSEDEGGLRSEAHNEDKAAEEAFDRMQEQIQDQRLNHQYHGQQEEYVDRPHSADTDPFYRRDSLQPGDLDVENPLDEKIRTPLMDHQTNSYFGETSPPVVNNNGSNNMMSTPTRKHNVGGVFGYGDVGNAAESPMARQDAHTPSSGYYPPIQAGRSGLNEEDDTEQLSPANTNPYHSPPSERDQLEPSETVGGNIGDFRRLDNQGGSDLNQDPMQGLMSQGLGTLPGLGAFGGGLGTPGMWGTPGLGRETGSLLGGGGPGTPGGSQIEGPGMGGSFFGGSAFGSIGGGSGPSSTLGLLGNPNASGFGAGRGSRLGALFPAEQQQELQQQQQQRLEAQARQQQQQQQQRSFDGDSYDGDGFDSLRIGDRRSDPRLMGGGLFDLSMNRPIGASDPNLFYSNERVEQQSRHVEPKSSFPQLAHANSISSLSQLGGGIAPAPGLTSTANATTRPNHIMVMPDKIQWVYRDPSGSIQGPFSGLEMHDWYKAGFFTPELAVRRQEDTEFEALGSFIRRIGNSREPFLVPMQGPPPPPGSGWSGVGPWGSPVPESLTGGTVQPPFAGSFPSFGTTLTADQQNALERRKQEEQYLMARQREYLVQQQVIAKQVAAAQHMSRISQESLHHQHSTQSLHSQPSLSNIQSPGGFQGIPPQAFPESATLLRHATSAGSLDSFNGSLGGMASRDDLQFQAAGAQPLGMAPFPVQASQAQVLERQRAQMQRQYQNQHQLVESRQLQQPYQRQSFPQSFTEGVQQGLAQQQQQQAQHETQYQVAAGDEPANEQAFDNDVSPDFHAFDKSKHDLEQEVERLPSSTPETNESDDNRVPEPTSKQNQMQSQAPPEPPKNPWNIPQSTGMPQPFPPPPLSSASPAPELAKFANTHPTTRSPSIDTPLTGTSASVAPWAQDVQVISKGPSLKEIQALEAQQAAKAEAAAAELRKEQLAAQISTQPFHAEQPAPGLPSTSNWASSQATPSTTAPWIKPMIKTATTPITGPARKTLAQIQKEEETRKTKALAQAALAASNASAAAAAQQATSTASATGRRSEWASKAAATPTPVTPAAAPGGAWTTIGASGKKTASTLTSTSRTSSTGAISVTSATTKPKPAPTGPATTSSSANSPRTAQDELQKWCKANLKGLNQGVDVNMFLDTLQYLPLEQDVIRDSVYASSSTIDARRFAEEYIRRRKLASQGIIPDSASFGNAGFIGGSSGFGDVGGNGGKANAGGWNEVAKKQKEVTVSNSPDNSPFKVVQPKKKGGRK